VLLREERHLCLDCLSSLPFTYFWNWKNNPAEQIFWGRVYFQKVASLILYRDESPYRSIIHQFKYNRQISLGRYFGSMLGKRLKESGFFNSIEVIVPVPLHPLKKWKRGYNQANVIAKAIGKELGVPVLNGVLVRTSFTSTQTTKDSQHRWKNVEKAFKLRRGERIKGRHVLLVDDVLTTGATLEACGTALLKAEGCIVSVATLAFVE
jgi:ComF family protein